MVTYGKFAAAVQVAVVKLLHVHVTVPSTTVSPTTFPAILGALPAESPVVVHSHTVVPVDHSTQVVDV